MDLSDQILPFLDAFYKKYPDFEIKIVSNLDYKLIRNIKEQIYDIAFDFGRNEKDEMMISRRLFSGPLYLYVLKSNPLAKKSMLELRDLQSQDLLIRSPSKGSGHAEMLHKLYKKLGVEPRFASYVDSAFDLSLNIQKDHQGILADAYYADRFKPYLVGIPVEGTKSNVWIRYIKQKENTDTLLFIDELFSYFHIE